MSASNSTGHGSNTDGIKKIDVESIGNLKIEPKPIKSVQLDDDTIQKYRQALNPSKTLWERTKVFLTATSKAGRKAKVIKDAILLFVPYGRQISNVTELTTHFLKEKNTMEDLLKRTLGTGGGSFIKVRNEDGNIDAIAILASVLRLMIIIAALWGASELGILPEIKSILGI